MTSFAVTWDYRCPFARNAHEHVVAGLAAGADWDVRFVPFSLGQVHVAEGDPPIWERPGDDSGLLALQAGVVVRDRHPAQFPAVHRDLFALRHDEGGDLRDDAAIRAVLKSHDVDTDSVMGAVEDGSALATVRAEHEEVATSHQVWGVPTFMVEDRAVFVRLMTRAGPGADGDASVPTVDRVLELLAEAPELNEFKHTSIPR